ILAVALVGQTGKDHLAARRHVARLRDVLEQCFFVPHDALRTKRLEYRRIGVTFPRRSFAPDDPIEVRPDLVLRLRPDVVTGPAFPEDGLAVLRIALGKRRRTE